MAPMTREEAARRFREKAEDHYYVPHLREMYQMAAEALEAEEAEKYCPHCGEKLEGRKNADG